VLELATYRDLRGRQRTLVLHGDLVLETARGRTPRVVCDLRKTSRSGNRRAIEQIVRDHVRAARGRNQHLRRVTRADLNDSDQLVLSIAA
jgi:hypothetical protein